jgi:hypothetical protein
LAATAVSVAGVFVVGMVVVGVVGIGVLVAFVIVVGGVVAITGTRASRRSIATPEPRVASFSCLPLRGAISCAISGDLGVRPSSLALLRPGTAAAHGGGFAFCSRSRGFVSDRSGAVTDGTNDLFYS